MGFISAIKNELDNEKQLTENGAVGYRTTGKELLDLNFSVASLRNMSETEISKRFARAFFEDKALALKWLFYARDVREGLGERRTFRVIFKELAIEYPKIAKQLITVVPEYGRWDDLWCLLDTELQTDVISFIARQLKEDLTNMGNGKSVSLCAKWLPSENASSKETKAYATIIRNGIGLTSKKYRKVLSALRSHINIVERQMSAKEWSEINYEAVPSRANLIYNSAFLRQDEQRRREYLNKLEKGEAKINASVLFPHDIVHKYTYSKKDVTLESLWKTLPDTVKECGNTIVVADGSGSMCCTVGNSRVMAIDIANALAIYFAEHSSGEFKDKYITFSEHPQLVDFSGVDSLYDKLKIAHCHREVANTNIEAVFNLILDTAVNNNMKQEDIPANILIISDMEFDMCARTNTVETNGYWKTYAKPDKTLFGVIADRYAVAGYKLPRLVFWNVNSRTGTIPVKQNELGVALVSGFSPNIAKMVMSGELDPYKCLLETINAERYEPIEKAVEGLL